MRVGKKSNVVDAKKTRSCVVRLEKVAKDSTSPVLLEDNTIRITRSNRLSLSNMGATPKGRRTGAATQQEDKTVRGPVKRRPIGSTSSSSSNLSTPQLQKTSSSNMSNIRSSQKIKVIPRSNKATSAATPSRDETPPPTIAAGRSRRAIKPNPKYASEDVVTPKVVRNVAALASSTNRGGSSSSAAVAGDADKARRASTSSDDFYNRNSDDDYENEMNDLDDDTDLHNDKAYQANEKEQDDSDFSEIEVQPIRVPRPRGRPRRVQETTAPTTHQSNKLPTQTLSSNIKKALTTSASTSNSANIRSTPSQLQQIRRSLANANAQRNLNLLAGSGSTAQKRKLEDSHDSSDTESNYTVKRKQLLLSNSAGLKEKDPVRDNRMNNTSAPLIKSRAIGVQKLSTSSTSFSHSLQQKQQSLNGGNKVNNSQSINRRPIEIATKTKSELTNQNNKSSSLPMSPGQQNNSLSTKTKIFAAKNSRLRSNSPKPTTFKHGSLGNMQTTLSMGINNRTSASDKLSTPSTSTNSKAKSISSPLATSVNDNSNDVKDNSPNSTIDDFETMPTFTIVNVNDIINKKGDVLITKSKSNNSKAPSVIEFTESIDLEDDDEEEVEEIRVSPPVKTQQIVSKRLPKTTAVSNRKEFVSKKSPLARSNESLRKLPTAHGNSTMSSKQAPQILNHKLGLRNSRVTPKTTTTLTATLSTPDKPAPRILNSVVAKKTQPVKPMIANMEDSADESFPLSLDEEDEEEDTEDEIESRQTNRTLSGKEKKILHKANMDMDTEDTESQNTEEDDVVLTTRDSTKSPSNNNALAPKQNTIQQRRKRIIGVSNTPIVVSNNKKKMTSATAAKENSLAATNQRLTDPTNPISPALPRKANAEKVVISKQGNKIIKKITCYETWYVINMPMEPKRPTVMKNQFEIPLIRLANNANSIGLPTDLWSSKVTLYELSPQTLGKSTLITYTGDLSDHNISEEDRGKYQPSCVMFRRSIEKKQLSRMPYDRAVIFKNKTFYTNIEGKNVRLIGAPSIINCESEIEILLEIVDALTLQSEFVEHISIVQ